MPDMLKNYGAATHTGYRRSRNEDRYLIKPLPHNRAILLAVADGLGGEAGGDISAQMVVDTLKNYPIPPETTAQDLADALVIAGKKIIRRTELETELEGMGTTATAVYVQNDRAFWAHVGDSRLYLFRNDNLTQISTDHTFVQELIDDGTLSQEDADRHPLSNMLDQCVGCSHLIPDSGSFRLQSGDKLLLCSDGLTRHVPDDAILTALENSVAQTAAERVVSMALEAGGNDNITSVVLICDHVF